MKKFLNTVLLLINAIVAGGLALSYISGSVNPQKVWILPFFGLAFFAFVVLNVAFVVFWLLRHRWYFLISAVMLACGCGLFKTIIRPSRSASIQGEKKLRLLSYNVNLFGLKYRPSSQIIFNEVADYIAHEELDVACLQEFFVFDEGRYNEAAINKALTNLPNRYIHYNVVKGNQKFGIATYSKHPIVSQGYITFANTTNAAIFTDIAQGSDTVRVYNVHLQSVRFGDYEKELLQGAASQNASPKFLRRASFKLKDAFIKRAKQVDAVVEHIKQSRYPVIVCGDFNDTPLSYSYRTMRQIPLNDGFTDAGRGIMSTYISAIPSFRIDYILYSPKFYATAYYCPNLKYSDHYPLVCRLINREVP
ncbi:MAG: endonuclease/exonuclease/phosphatase family protein [Prevotellaceae bacterium]|nr:endonuclease/exonuclease/phosphatase family protein [Prevotellaceae bacterium]